MERLEGLSALPGLSFDGRAASKCLEDSEADPTCDLHGAREDCEDAFAGELAPGAECENTLQCARDPNETVMCDRKCVITQRMVRSAFTWPRTRISPAFLESVTSSSPGPVVVASVPSRARRSQGSESTKVTCLGPRSRSATGTSNSGCDMTARPLARAAPMRKSQCKDCDASAVV